MGRHSPESIKQHKAAVWDESKKQLGSSIGVTHSGEGSFLGVLVLHQHVTFYVMWMYIWDTSSTHHVLRLTLCIVMWEKTAISNICRGCDRVLLPELGTRCSGHLWLLHHLQVLCGRVERKGGKAPSVWIESSFKKAEDKLLLIKACMIYGMSFACQNFPKQS